MDSWETFLRRGALATETQEQMTGGLQQQACLRALEQQLYCSRGLVVSFSEDGSQVRVRGAWQETEVFLRGLDEKNLDK